MDYAYACLEQRQSQDTATAAVYRAHNEMPAPGASSGQADARARGDDPLVIMRVSVHGGESFLIGRQPGEGSRDLRGDHLRRENAELDKSADLGALD
ncbi:hypothetical protein ACWGCC_01420 [Streptomyces nigrescens]